MSFSLSYARAHSLKPKERKRYEGLGGHREDMVGEQMGFTERDIFQPPHLVFSVNEVSLSSRR